MKSFYCVLSFAFGLLVYIVALILKEANILPTNVFFYVLMYLIMHETISIICGIYYIDKG